MLGRMPRAPPTAPDEVQGPAGNGLPTAHRITWLCRRGPAHRGACPLSNQAATTAEAEDPGTKAQAKETGRDPVAPRLDQRAAKSDAAPIAPRDDHQVHAASTLFLGSLKSRVLPLSQNGYGQTLQLVTALHAVASDQRPVPYRSHFSSKPVGCFAAFPQHANLTSWWPGHCPGAMISTDHTKESEDHLSANQMRP